MMSTRLPPRSANSRATTLPGKAAANHNGIDLREVYFGVGNKIHSHRFLSAHKRFARRLSRCKGHIWSARNSTQVCGQVTDFLN